MFHDLDFFREFLKRSAESALEQEVVREAQRAFELEIIRCEPLNLSSSRIQDDES